MNKYGFVILNYLAYKTTISCAEQIIKISFGYDYNIIIVDNDSNNNSYEILNKYFYDNDNITVLENKKNLGFAKGNNIGFNYLKSHYNPNYILILNSDVIIDQENFLEEIDKIYNKYHYDVIGPDIYSPNAKIHQNPSRFYPIDDKELDSRIDYYRKYVSNTCYGKAFRLIKNTKNLLSKKIKIIIRKNDSYKISDLIKHFDGYYTLKNHNNIRHKQAENVVLHGACYIFTQRYIINETNAFNPSTFLYMEEDILYEYCKKKKYTMAYCPSLHVIHLEDVSTNMKYKNYNDKNYAVIKYSLDSALILRNIIQNK